jgi:hypothetical protein
MLGTSMGRGVDKFRVVRRLGKRACIALLVGAAAFGASASGDWRSGPVESAYAATLATYELNIIVAPGLAPSAVVIGTSGTLYMRDRSSVTAPLSNVGVGASELGVEARGVDIYSEPTLTLRDRAKLSGAAVVKGSTVIRGNDTSIAGGVTTGASFADPAGKTFLAAWPTGGGVNYDLQPGQALTLSAGVAYGNISVKRGATLTITAGEHFVKSLTVEPDANVVLLDGTDRISLFVKDSMIWRGKLTTQSGAGADWLVGYLGTQRVPLESAFRGLLLAPNAEVTLATISTGKHTGQFFAKKIEVQPDVAVVFQPSRFFNEPTPTAGSLPDANDPRCGKSSLVLGGHVKDGALDRYGSISQTTPTPGCPLVELCQSDEPGAPKADLAALNARLNSPSTPTQPCDTFGKAAAGACPADPTSIDKSKQCNADTDCANYKLGDVCVPYCVDKACTQIQHGCAKRYDCTGADDDDPKGCDTQIAYQCSDPNDFGETHDSQVSDKLPPKTNVTLSVPPGDVAQVKSYVDVDTTSYCNGLGLEGGSVSNGDAYQEPVPQAGKTPSALQEEGSPVVLGNSTWGLFANPRIFHKAEINHKRLDQFKLDVEAQGSLVAGAKVFGKAITGLDARGGAKITQCGADASGKFQLFGETIAGLNGVNTHSDACETAFEVLAEVSSLLEESSRLARKLAKLYDPSLTGAAAQTLKENICGEVVSALGLNDPTPTVNCTTTSVSAEQWVNVIVERYKNQAADYASKRLAFFQSAIGTETSSAGLPFLDLGEPFTIVGVHSTIPIGPVSLVVDVQVFGHWGLKGTIDYGLDMGAITGGQVTGDPALSAGATIKPEVELHAALYVGVGIDLGFAGASVGLEGDLTLIEASAPVRISMGIKRATHNETDIDPSHNYQTSDFAGNALAGIPVGKAYTWDGFWKFGAAFNLASLSGDLNAAARVHFLFFSKTFRKKIAHWTGFEKTFSLATVGGSTSFPSGSDLLPESLTFNGALGFGDFTDQVAFTQLDKVGSGSTATVPFGDSEPMTGCVEPPK